MPGSLERLRRPCDPTCRNSLWDASVRSAAWCREGSPCTGHCPDTTARGSCGIRSSKRRKHRRHGCCGRSSCCPSTHPSSSCYPSTNPRSSRPGIRSSTTTPRDRRPNTGRRHRSIVDRSGRLVVNHSRTSSTADRTSSRHSIRRTGRSSCPSSSPSSSSNTLCRNTGRTSRSGNTPFRISPRRRRSPRRSAHRSRNRLRRRVGQRPLRTRRVIEPRPLLRQCWP